MYFGHGRLPWKKVYGKWREVRTRATWDHWTQLPQGTKVISTKMLSYFLHAILVVPSVPLVAVLLFAREILRSF